MAENLSNFVPLTLAPHSFSLYTLLGTFSSHPPRDAFLSQRATAAVLVLRTFLISCYKK